MPAVIPILNIGTDTPPLQENQVTQCLAATIRAGEQATEFGVLLRMKFSRKQGAEELFEAGRTILAPQCQDWEGHHMAGEAKASADRQRLLADFRKQLEPAPKQYDASDTRLSSGFH